MKPCLSSTYCHRIVNITYLQLLGLELPKMFSQKRINRAFPKHFLVFYVYNANWFFSWSFWKTFSASFLWLCVLWNFWFAASAFLNNQFFFAEKVSYCAVIEVVYIHKFQSPCKKERSGFKVLSYNVVKFESCMCAREYFWCFHKNKFVST